MQSLREFMDFIDNMQDESNCVVTLIGDQSYTEELTESREQAINKIYALFED